MQLCQGSIRDAAECLWMLHRAEVGSISALNNEVISGVVLLKLSRRSAETDTGGLLNFALALKV